MAANAPNKKNIINKALINGLKLDFFIGEGREPGLRGDLPEGMRAMMKL
jgi:hypothetical protein